MSVGLSFLLLVGSVQAREPSSEQQERFTGIWLIAESMATLRPGLEQAMDKAVASLFAPLRPLAKIKLRPELEPCRDYHLTLTKDTFSFHCGFEEDFRVSLLGDTTTFDDGDPYKVTTVVTDETVKVSVMGEEGGKKTDWTLYEDGKKLKVSSAIVSQHLAEPLAWVVRYRRQE
jgi:hypothetical protein